MERAAVRPSIRTENAVRIVYAANGTPSSGRLTLATLINSPNGITRTKLACQWPKAIARRPIVGPPAVVPLLMLAAFIAGLMITLGSISELSLRQGITPQHLQGRMNATMRSLNWSTVTDGALIGGTLGDSIGLTPTLLIGAVGSLLSSVWLIASPVRYLRDTHDRTPRPRDNGRQDL
jgi:hypothetical protein